MSEWSFDLVMALSFSRRRGGELSLSFHSIARALGPKLTEAWSCPWCS